MPVLQSRNPGIRKRSFPGFDDDDDDDDCSSSGLEVPIPIRCNGQITDDDTRKVKTSLEKWNITE